VEAAASAGHGKQVDGRARDPPGDHSTYRGECVTSWRIHVGVPASRLDMMTRSMSCLSSSKRLDMSGYSRMHQKTASGFDVENDNTLALHHRSETFVV